MQSVLAYTLLKVSQDCVFPVGIPVFFLFNSAFIHSNGCIPFALLSIRNGPNLRRKVLSCLSHK